MPNDTAVFINPLHGWSATNVSTVPVYKLEDAIRALSGSLDQTECTFIMGCMKPCYTCALLKNNNTCN